MDVVTHALMGLIGGSALAPAHPEAAAAFAFGSVLPDLDAFSRVAGKRAFLRAHQTWSHALPVIAALGLVSAVALRLAGLDLVESTWTGAALACGMALHALTDWTNTFGIMLLAPFSRRRLCTEWVFFIDAVVLGTCATTLALIALDRNGPRGLELQLGCAGVLAAYWAAKGLLRRRAAAVAPAGTHSLLPSALVPWEFLGCARDAGPTARTFKVNALTGAVRDAREHELLDERFAAALAGVPDFAVMRALSPGYHVVAAEPSAGGGTTLRCRDLRTRNFATTFGAIDVELDAQGTVRHVELHA